MPRSSLRGNRPACPVTRPASCVHRAWPRGRSPARGCTRRFTLRCLTVTTSVRFLQFCSFLLSPRGNRTMLSPRLRGPMAPARTLFSAPATSVGLAGTLPGLGQKRPDVRRVWTEEESLSKAHQGPVTVPTGGAWTLVGVSALGHDVPEGHVSSVLDSLQQLVPVATVASSGWCTAASFWPDSGSPAELSLAHVSLSEGRGRVSSVVLPFAFLKRIPGSVCSGKKRA